LRCPVQLLIRTYEAPGSQSNDPESHLSGASAFVNIQQRCISLGGLFESAFWIFVRQDIYAALVTQRPMKANLSAIAVDMDFDRNETDSCVWANRIVWLVADIVTLCFGGSASVKHWDALKTKVELWMSKKPDSFNPVYYRESDPEEGRPFPEIYMSQQWHRMFKITSSVLEGRH
jgi:hypothetical protein